MKDEIRIRDDWGDEIRLNFGFYDSIYIGAADEAMVGLYLPQAKKLSKWLKKAIKELEKREAERLEVVSIDGREVEK